MRRTARRESAQLVEVACGMTVDLFCQPEHTGASVQWLWSAPLDRLADRGLDEREVLDRIVEMTRRAGFHPDTHSSLHRMLLNGSGHEAACPFSRDECSGAHLVVTGAGRVGARPLRRAASMVDLIAAHTPLLSR
ncbi:hypothetical protein [Microcella sp.]|uniref:hypothetical protein n=1 Tax=Microcella sp. TaxID=1913979 RepID=UPI003F6EA214